MCRIFRKTRLGTFEVIAPASASEPQAFVSPDSALSNKAPKKPRPKFGDTVEAFASSSRRAGYRSCRRPSLITHW